MQPVRPPLHHLYPLVPVLSARISPTDSVSFNVSELTLDRIRVPQTTLSRALSKPYFHCEEAAFEHVESALWPAGPVRPHCGSISHRHYDLKKTRIGLRKCADCRKQFTVRVGTVFESSHLPLHKWLQAVYLMCSSKKGVSAHQLHRVLEITYKSAWFMAHRIREAMRSGDLAPMGGDGGAVEVDETFIGRERGKPIRRAYHHKMKVLTLVERNTGRATSMVVGDLKPATIAPILRENMAREARLMTDEAGHYASTRHRSGWARPRRRRQRRRTRTSPASKPGFCARTEWISEFERAIGRPAGQHYRRARVIPVPSEDWADGYIVNRVVIEAIAKARVWVRALAHGTMKDFAELAAETGHSEPYLRRLIRLAWLAPGIVQGLAAGNNAIQVNRQQLRQAVPIVLLSG